MSELRPTFADLATEADYRAKEWDRTDAIAVDLLLVRQLLTDLRAIRAQFGWLVLCWGCYHPVILHQKVHPSEYPLHTAPRRCTVDGECSCTYVGGWLD
jgi:hypothetical protein